jgi:hypothetical protein
VGGSVAVFFITSTHTKVGAKDLHTDAMNFTEHFEDLTESNHHLKNEWVLKHFFRSKDPTKRKPIEVEGLGNISDANERTKIVL